ncbi:hypothetical protein SBX64_07910 [Vibrio rhizosphaerae]|uniref:Bacterial CdiA-CT RNAse A domain-containing protein n=1 Tax=Vibrio rhizosphaerae TaxID=398736 RepID=A0ABU4ISS9_9VIBR|nr:hypothetical protein [Vibrio rhizosphaerae]MDW6092467.1 hypothetical protein [Vibrio rhizosphaerae]
MNNPTVTRLDDAKSAEIGGGTVLLPNSRTTTSILMINDRVDNNYSLDSFTDVGNKISQKQMRHVAGRKEYRGGGFMDSLDDAQKVLDAYNSGKSNIIGKSKQGFPIIKVEDVTGTNVSNVASGTYKQATNIFMVKGTKSPSIVPMNPNWSDK